MVVAVKPGNDLIAVACEFARDNKSAVEQWLKEGAIFQPSDEDSLNWLDRNSLHWSVVVAPWVLVQDV